AALENGKLWIVKLLSELQLVPSNAEARRMVQQGAVKINEEKVASVDDHVAVEEGMIVQVGKRKFAKVVVK
ncbi:S4 domain-containing protein, partial [Cohnella sp. REN36]